MSVSFENVNAILRLRNEALSGVNEMSGIDWSKAPEDATHHQAESHGIFECWLKPGYAVRVSRGTVKWVEDTSANHFISTSATARPLQQWNGEGLPPVGADVEVLHAMYGWIGAKVVGADGTAAIVRTNDGYAGVYPHEIRPIRTPEQVAEDEREAVIDHMLSTYLDGAKDHRGGIRALYDAGYRKP